jgi:Domain of unknown function (DUF4456)
VILTHRYLLRMPFAALAAIVKHETSYFDAELQAQQQALASTQQALEQVRAQHQMRLSPELAHPARHADLENLCAAETERGTQLTKAVKHAALQLHARAPELVGLAQRRLVAATQQLAQQLDNTLLTTDLRTADHAGAQGSDVQVGCKGAVTDGKVTLSAYFLHCVLVHEMRDCMYHTHRCVSDCGGHGGV